MERPPLSLYVHLPWCESKCPYCDFNSHVWASVPQHDYVRALLADLDVEIAHAGEAQAVGSVFLGGGTPSLFSPGAIVALLDGVRARLALAPACEVTLEANPGTVLAAHLAGYRAAGVTRVSLGVQSFDDGALARIGRVHDARTARAALDAVADAGFASFNVDIMYGLPGQNVAQALADVEQALASGADHVSHYELTIEPNTRFWSAPPVLPDDEAKWRMHELAAARLAAAGLARYEVSAWARAGARCRHNVNYWRFGDYLGIGAGAHGKLSRPATGRIERSRKHRRPERYLAGAGRAELVTRREDVAPELVALEFMLNAARLVEGFETSLFTARTGLAPAAIAPALERAAARGLIERDPGRVVPTALGMRFLDDLVALFAAAPERSASPGEGAKRAAGHREAFSPVL
ncbi:MAG: radical SAM family heme chaperone HemW [Gammaproteobacteria bacterium]|nr:radical SAM family heme chaperone HemW [Gammaproteobacteria bacterium]